MRIRRLFLCEKPKVGRQIAPLLGSVSSRSGCLFISNGDVVTWTAGHAYENAPAVFYDKNFKPWARENLPLIPSPFVILPKKSMSEQLAVIKKLLADTETVVSVGDPDREGNLLIDEILEQLKWNGPTKRIMIKGNDEKSLIAAIADVKDNRDFATWTRAARLRSQIDWIAGINHTVALTVFGRKLGIDTLMTVGRVQTPLLYLIVMRKREIQNFKPTTYIVMQAAMDAGSGKFSSSLIVDKDATGVDSEGRIVCPKYASSVKAACEGQSGEVIAVERKGQKGDPPLPLCLSSLQEMANKKFGLEPEATLAIAQKLYDDGFTTYPRTGCPYIPEGQFPEAPEIISGLAACNESGLQKLARGANPKLRSKAFDDSKVEAHYGLIPTSQKPDFSVIEGINSEIYKLIATYYLLQFYPPEEYETQSILVKVNEFTWKAHGRVCLKPGWKGAFKEADDNEKDQGLPIVQKGHQVKCSEVKAEQKQTTPPPYFTPGSIIGVMKQAHKFVTDPKMRATLRGVEGLGTEATRAGIYKSLKDRGYIEVKANKILPTALGEQLIDLVPPGMKDIGMTALLENKLELVFNGKLEPGPIFEEYAKSLKPAIDALFSSNPTLSVTVQTYPCPNNCGTNLRRVKSKKNGKIFWICPTEGCEYIVDDVKGKPGKPRPKAEISSEFSCPDCGKPLVRRQGNYGFWWSCSGFKDGCKFTAPDENGKPGPPRERLEAKGEFRCPECDTPLKFIEGKDKRRWHICENAKKHKRKKTNFYPDNNGVPVFD